MSGFEVRNELGEAIIKDSLKLYALTARQNITEITPWSQLQNPSLVDGVPIGSCSLPSLGNADLLTLLDFSTAAPGNVYGCGNLFFSAYAGTLVHLSRNVPVESGFLDIYDSSGTLVWSAVHAAKVPRVTRTHHLTYAQLVAGVTISIAEGEMLMLNNLAAYNLPIVRTIVRGGLYWKKSGNSITFKAVDISTQYIVDMLPNAYAAYGVVIYFYRFSA